MKEPLVFGRNHVVRALLQKDMASKPYPYEHILQQRSWKETLFNLAIGLVAIAVIVLLGFLQKW